MQVTTFFNKFELLIDSSNAVQCMREYVLELACQGSLVPQCMSDESASELARRIEAHLSQLRKTKALREPPVEAIDQDASLSELPANWTWVRLGNVARYGSPDKLDSKQISSDAWLLDLEDVEKNTSRILQRKTFADNPSRSTKAAFAKGDVLYGKLRPYLNKVVVADAPGYCTTEVIAISGFGFIDPRYLCYALKRPSFLAYANAKSYGVKMPRLGTLDARMAPFPLPPLAEQKRIVAKVDALMALLDELEQQQQEREHKHAALARASLARFADDPTPKNLTFLFHKSYDITPADLRQAILTMAVEGCLVGQSEGDGDVADLLVQNDSKRCSVAGGDRRANEDLTPMLSKDLRWEVPGTWQWRSLTDLVLFVDYRGRTPRKKPRGIRLITAKNVRPWVINLDPEEFITETEYDEWMTRGLPKIGDVLFTTEAPMGNAAVVRLEECFALAQRVICFQGYGAVDPHFLVIQLLSKQWRSILEENATGLTAKGIKGAKLKRLPIAIPPLAEQRRIVEKVDRLMALVDELEAQLARSRTLAANLLEAVVAELTQPEQQLPQESSTPRRAAARAHGDYSRNRASLIAYVASERRRHVPRGRAKRFGVTGAEKMVFLLESHLGIECGGKWQRAPFGPYDPDGRASAEDLGRKLGWFAVGSAPESELRPIELGKAAADAFAHFRVIAGDQLTTADGIIKEAAAWDTRQAELYATVYAVWNDLLFDRRLPGLFGTAGEVNYDDVATGVLSWHESKKDRFSDGDIEQAMRRLKAMGLIPHGRQRLIAGSAGA